MNEALAKTNFEYCSRTILLKNELEMSYIELGQRLEKITEEKMYEPNYESFDEFLQEVNISRGTASKLINVWKRFVVEFKIKPKMLAEAGGWSKVAEILPYVETKKQAEEWLIKSKSMSQSDLRKELIEAKTGIFMGECPHEKREVISFWRCVDCGETERVYEQEK